VIACDAALVGTAGALNERDSASDDSPTVAAVGDSAVVCVLGWLTAARPALSTSLPTTENALRYLAARRARMRAITTILTTEETARRHGGGDTGRDRTFRSAASRAPAPAASRKAWRPTTYLDCRSGGVGSTRVIEKNQAGGPRSRELSRF